MIDDDEKLINLVRKFKSLYDKRDINYKNIAIKKSAWEAIGSILEASAEDAEQRWNILRNRYASERRKLKDTGPGSITLWNLYDTMSFVAEFVKPRKRYGKTRIARQSMPSLVPQLDDEAHHATKIEEWDSDSSPFVTMHDGEVVISGSLPDPLGTSPAVTSSLGSTSSNSQSAIPSSFAALNIPSPNAGLARPPDDMSMVAGPSRKRPLSQGESDKAAEPACYDVTATMKAPEQENGDILFGHSVGLTLTQFSKKKKARAKIEILQVLEKYEDEDAE